MFRYAWCISAIAVPAADVRGWERQRCLVLGGQQMKAVAHDGLVVVAMTELGQRERDLHRNAWGAFAIGDPCNDLVQVINVEGARRVEVARNSLSDLEIL